MITDGIRGSAIALNDERKERQKRLVHFFVDTLHMHNSYAYAYFFCEFLNFINVVSIEMLISAQSLIRIVTLLDRELREV